MGAVIEFQHWHALKRVSGCEFRAFLIHLAQINRNHRYRDALFRQKNPDTTGIGHPASIEQLHPRSPALLTVRADHIEALRVKDADRPIPPRSLQGRDDWGRIEEVASRSSRWRRR